MTTRPATPVQWLQDNFREFRIERRHIAALTWEAMFRSRRAAILAGGGGGSYTSDTMASSRSGLFCAAFDCSNNNSVQKARDFFRFQKEHNLLLFIKKINDLVGTRPI